MLLRSDICIPIIGVANDDVLDDMIFVFNSFLSGFKCMFQLYSSELYIYIS